MNKRGVMYSIKQLELFISLARTQRVVETAKEYEMSQSAVSMSTRELEKELGEPLFDRIGKKLILNDRGHLLIFFWNVASPMSKGSKISTPTSMPLS